MTIEITVIGKINQGIDGSDEYLLLKNKEEALTPQAARDWLLPRVYRDSPRPGSYFCHSVTTVQQPYRDDEVIAIVHHRYDV